MDSTLLQSNKKVELHLSKGMHLPFKQEKSQKTKDAPGLLLRMRKRSLSCNIASTIVYDTDLNTITQSAEIALERP